MKLNGWNKVGKIQFDIVYACGGVDDGTERLWEFSIWLYIQVEFLKKRTFIEYDVA